MKLSLSWSKYYKLSSDSISQYAPNRAGVYKISVLQSDDTLKVSYIGQTKNINERMSQHLNDDGTDNKCLAEKIEKYTCKFSFAEVARQEERDAAERALYDYYKPRCNDPDRIPDVEPADMNYKNM